LREVFSNYITKYIAMKKILCAFTIMTFMILSIQGQTVANYSYLLDNGINIKAEHCWDHVWISQTYEASTDATQANPLAVNIRTLGDLIISGSTIKLFSAGKEVRMQGAPAGTYELKVTTKLSGKPGVLSFVASNIIIKPKTKTSVSVILYDYQYTIAETAAVLSGLSSYESTVNCFKGSPGQNPHKLVMAFYAKGKRDVKIIPAEGATDTKGKIKSGTYDVLMTITISGQKHEIWLENFTLKPDVNYKIGTNLNAGIIIYTGGNKDVKTLHLYPAGAAAQQTAKPAPDKTREIISYDNITATNACPPGSYDVLLGFGSGNKYEWRKNIPVQTGGRAEVK
jgi:hypothetical protein